MRKESLSVCFVHLFFLLSAVTASVTHPHRREDHHTNTPPPAATSAPANMETTVASHEEVAVTPPRAAVASSATAGAGTSAQREPYDYRGFVGAHYPHFVRADGNLSLDQECTLSPDDIHHLPLSSTAKDILSLGGTCQVSIVPRGVFEHHDKFACSAGTPGPRRLVRRTANRTHAMLKDHDVSELSCLMRSGFHVFISVRDATRQIEVIPIGYIDCQFTSYDPLKFGDMIFPILQCSPHIKLPFMNHGLEGTLTELLIKHFEACKASIGKYALLYPDFLLTEIHDARFEEQSEDEAPADDIGEIDLQWVKHKFEMLSMEGEDCDPRTDRSLLVCDTEIPLTGLMITSPLDHWELHEDMKERDFQMQRPVFQPLCDGFGTVSFLWAEEMNLWDHFPPFILDEACKRNHMHTLECIDVLRANDRRVPLVIVDECDDHLMSVPGETNDPAKWRYDWDDPADRAKATMLSLMFDSKVSDEYTKDSALWETTTRELTHTDDAAAAAAAEEN